MVRMQRSKNKNENEMNQISKDDIAQSDLDRDASTQDHLKFQMFCNHMFSRSVVYFKIDFLWNSDFFAHPTNIWRKALSA